MPISLECKCGRSFRARDEAAGKRVKCPDCGAPVLVPAPEDDEEEVMEAVEAAPADDADGDDARPRKKKKRRPRRVAEDEGGANYLKSVRFTDPIGTLLPDRRNFHHQRRPVSGPAVRGFASISPGTRVFVAGRPRVAGRLPNPALFERRRDTQVA